MTAFGADECFVLGLKGITDSLNLNPLKQEFTTTKSATHGGRRLDERAHAFSFRLASITTRLPAGPLG
jgi:hypothetical protein